MSTTKPILSAMLTVLGLMGLASADAADPQPPEASSGTPPAIAPAQGAEADSASSSSPPGVILLTDGQVVQGTIVEDDSGCLLTTPYGSKRFPKGRIEKTFRTLRDAYEYKQSQFPDEDTEERLKLAQWCIAQNLQEEAKAQLQGILKINPKHPPAKAMLEKIEQAEVNKAKRRFDPSVQQAKATSDDMTEAGPKQLDPAALMRSNPKSLVGGIADVPDIFNLPRPKALKLMEEFDRRVHLVLQNHCAKCHNERYPGNFQLRQVRNRRDLNRDTLKINLEAALQLIDPSNPSKSEILSSSLRPHGYGKTKRPIFKGSNDPSYLKLSEWVNNVCEPLNSDAIRQTSAQARSTDEGERFAADRVMNVGESQSASSQAPVAPTRRNQADRSRLQSPPAMKPLDRTGAQAAGADPSEFPLSDLSHATSLRSAGSVHVRTDVPAGAGSNADDSPKNPGKASNKPSVQGRDASTDLPELPPEADLSPSPATKKKPKTPVKIDPALLERALKARNGGGN